MGLLESITDEDILKNHDPYDYDNDGISGRVNWWQGDQKSKGIIGRFGHRASTPNIKIQSSLAFMNDIGISNPLAINEYGDCTKLQIECINMPHGIQEDLGKYETTLEVLDKIDFYLSSLSPPKRRDVSNKEVLKGKEVFYKSGCVSCHVPKYVSSKQA